MITNTLVKSYLCIDIDDDDTLIDSFIGMAKAYLGGAIDDFATKYANTANASFITQVDQWMLFYVAELYQNRNIYAEGTEPSFHLRSLMLQLQTFEPVEAEASDDESADEAEDDSTETEDSTNEGI